jgi:hypothetical protein
MKAKTCQLLFLILWGVFSASCQKGCNKEVASPPHDPAKDVADHGEKKREILAGLNYDGLTEVQITSLNKLFHEEICPCGCPSTFAQCLSMPSGCKQAQLLANWMIKQVKFGAPEPFLYRAVSDEISTGFLAEEKTIDTKQAHRKGQPNAPITVVEFADFECGACKIAASEMKAFVNENSQDVQIYFMHFPLSTHPNAERAAIASEAAGKQGKFWEMHDKLFAYNGPLTEAVTQALAKELFSGQELKQFIKDLADPALARKIKEHKEYAQNVLLLGGTPSFMFNGRPYHLSSARDGFALRVAMEKVRSDIHCGSNAHK